MSILNQLSNHVGTIQAPLSKLALRTPDRVLQILDTRAKYEAGVATAGYDLSYLRDTPEAMFYRGSDRVEAQEADPQVDRIIVPWTNMMAPLQFSGTDLEETVGMRSDRMTDDDYSLAEMNNDSRYMFINFVMTRAAGTASGIQQARVDAQWGNDTKIQLADGSRMPITIPQICDPNTGLYGEPVDALGEFEPGHPWAATDETTKATNFGRSRSYKMTPRHWNIQEDDGTAGTSNDGNTRGERNNRFNSLYNCISEYSQIVPGTKIAICNNRVFTQLALRYAQVGEGGEAPYKYPTLVGNDQWRMQVRSVLMEDVYFISDPYMTSETEIYVLHIGDQGAGNGTVFPYYWVPDVDIPELLRRETEMALRDIPDGMVWGGRRDVPFYLDKFRVFDGRADMVGAWQRLKYSIVATEPWCNMLIDGLPTGTPWV